MKRILSITAAALAVTLAVPAAAYAQQVGTVASVSGPQGSVLVVRGSETYFLSSGDALFAGDQIFVRTEGSIQLSGSGCSVPMSAGSSITLGADMCQAQPVDFSGEVPGSGNAGAVKAGGDVASSGPLAGVGGAVAGANPAVLAVAGIAGVGGIAAAAGDDDSSSPSSP